MELFNIVLIEKRPLIMFSIVGWDLSCLWSINYLRYSVVTSILAPSCPRMGLPWWCNDMETFSALLALCEENLLVTSEFVSLTHICVGNLTIIVSDNGLSPGRRQAIIWTNAGIVNWTLRNKLQWNFHCNSNIFIEENALPNVVCEMASVLCRPQCVKGQLCRQTWWWQNSQFLVWVYNMTYY